MENNLPTAKQYLKNIGLSEVMSEYDLIEFAKLHVQAALKAWFEKIKSEGLVTDSGIAYLENAYPLENIK